MFGPDVPCEIQSSLMWLLCCSGDLRVCDSAPVIDSVNDEWVYISALSVSSIVAVVECIWGLVTMVVNAVWGNIRVYLSFCSFAHFAMWYFLELSSAPPHIWWPVQDATAVTNGFLQSCSQMYRDSRLHIPVSDLVPSNLQELMASIEIP